jgi:hypothetical protein
MSSDFHAWTAQVRRLDQALSALEPAALRIGAPPAGDQEWCQLLRVKLRPQLDSPPLLLVAIVGGTNLGKSVLFNHLAGEVASAVSPLAAGTKHPVCLVPPDMNDVAALSRVFEGFRLAAWQSPDDPLAESPENLVFWRPGARVPARLLLLDAPDVDSDVAVNWRRARAIRQAADVLIAVLTQQKYNDAAVKQFFREAVEADKPIVVVFNQCELAEDGGYWPEWLATFKAQTGAEPELVYVVPRDRRAADALSLPFFEVGRDGRRTPDVPADLRQELAALHFDAIKIRTFRGAMSRVLDARRGAPAYLAAVRAAAGQYASAHRALAAGEMARVAWPTLPAAALVDEIRGWWDQDRPPWARSIHGFYRTLGQGLTWPVRRAQAALRPPADPLASFRGREREAILLAVEKMLDELERLSKVGNETLRPRLAELLGGHSREQLLARVGQAHQRLPAVDDDYRAFLRAELDAWKGANPRALRFIRSMDHVAAVARPAITVLLFVSGWHVAGDLAGQAVAQAAGHTVGQLAQEAAIAGGITGGGEALVSTTSEGISQAAARLFGRLQSRYAQQRAAWLANWLEQELLGDLLAQLRAGAEVPAGTPFQTVEQSLAALDQEAIESQNQQQPLR